MAEAEGDRGRQRVERPEVEHPPVGARQREHEGQHRRRPQTRQQEPGRAERAGAGEGVSQPAQNRQRGERHGGSRQGADDHQTGRGDGRQLLAGHLADEHLLAERRHDRDDQHGRQRSQDSGRHGAVALRLVAQRAPARRTGAGDRVDEELGPQGAENRRRAVEADRQGDDAERAAVIGREQQVEEARPADSGQDRSSDRAPQTGDLHPDLSQLARAGAAYNLTAVWRRRANRP